MTARLTFLSHFVICLACVGSAFFAWQRGVPQMVYANDMSMMTSVIAALFVVTCCYLGRQAWMADGGGWVIDPTTHLIVPSGVDATFGHLAEGLAVRLGLIGTGIGIVLTIKASLASANPLSALQTAFFSMICGVAASSLIAVMTYSLERGIEGARK